MLSKTNLSNLAILVVFALIQAGCSMSMSVESSSDSSGSVSTSLDSIASSASSASSDDEDEEEKVEETASLYEEDIAAITVLYVRNQNDDEFKRQITDTAGTHGINDWEQEVATFKAMGKGLKRAGINENEIKTMPYFQNLTEKSQLNLVIAGLKN